MGYTEGLSLVVLDVVFVGTASGLSASWESDIHPEWPSIRADTPLEAVGCDAGKANIAIPGHVDINIKQCC